MLQSIKRAHKLDPLNPKLHTCLIRFCDVINNSKDTWESSVEQVVTKEVETFLCGKDANQLNKEYLESNKDSLESVLEGAKMLYYLDLKNQNTALDLITNLDNKFKDVNITVSTIIFVKE